MASACGRPYALGFDTPRPRGNLVRLPVFSGRRLGSRIAFAAAPVLARPPLEEISRDPGPAIMRLPGGRTAKPGRARAKPEPWILRPLKRLAPFGRQLRNLALGQKAGLE